MDTVLSWLWRTGSRRALDGEGWPWALLAAAALLWRRARRPEKDKVVFLKVEPGQRYEIDVIDREAERRARRRRAAPWEPAAD